MRLRPTLWIALAAATSRGASWACADESFRIVPEHAVLETGGRTVAALPASARRGAPGTVEITPDRHRLRASDAATGTERWVATMPVGRRWRDLGTTATTAYGAWLQPDVAELVVPPRDDDRLRWVADGAGTVRRLALADGTWRPAWTVEGPVRQVIVCDRDVVVVSDPEPGRVGFTCFAADADTARWRRSLRSAVPAAGTPAYYSALPTGAVPEETSSVAVAAAGDVLVTCAGASQEIVALDRVDGSVRWQVDRLWELERYREPPNQFGWGFLRPTSDAARRDLARRCRIVAGPFVVGEGATPRLFFGVTRDRVEGTGAPVAESVTYELEGPYVVSISRLPQPVRRDGSRPLDGGVLWRCGEDALAFQVPSEQRFGEFKGIGSTDRSGWLRWYREATPAPPLDAWLRTARGDACLATDRAEAWFVGGGPYIRAQDDGAFRVLLRRLDLRTGTEREATLVVPYTGSLPSREAVNRTTTTVDGAERIEVLQSFAVEVRALALRDGRLEIDVAAVAGGGRIAFSTEALR